MARQAQWVRNVDKKRRSQAMERRRRSSPRQRHFPGIETIKSKASRRLPGECDKNDDEAAQPMATTTRTRTRTNAAAPGDVAHTHRYRRQLIKAAAIWISQADKTGLFRGNVLSCCGTETVATICVAFQRMRLLGSSQPGTTNKQQQAKRATITKPTRAATATAKSSQGGAF